jgi:hypothetical protein
MRISTPNIWFGIAGATECYVNDALIGAFTYFTHAPALLGPKATFAPHLMHSIGIYVYACGGLQKDFHAQFQFTAVD